jgi:hypothetical protein
MANAYIYDHEFDENNNENEEGDSLRFESREQDEEECFGSDLGDGEDVEEEGDNGYVCVHQQGAKFSRKIVPWAFEKQFDSLENAMAELKNKWKRWKEHVTVGGVKEYYKCVWAKCPCKIYLYYRAANQISIMNNQCTKI